MDRVRIQVLFKKALWTCPVCKLEEWEDRPMDGGASYEHTCKNGHKFNQSGNNMKEFNSSVSYTPEEYDTLKNEDLISEKQGKADAWLDSVKNPPPYVEPKISDYENMIADKQAEIAQLQSQKAEAEAKINAG